MENKEMNYVDAPIIRNFLDRSEGVFRSMIIKSALYMGFYDYCEYLYVIQTMNGNCFIFEFCGGELEHIKEECNAMEKYMKRIPYSDYVEYIKFN